MGTLTKCLTTAPLSAEDKQAIRDLVADAITKRGEDPATATVDAVEQILSDAETSHQEIVSQVEKKGIPAKPKEVPREGYYQPIPEKPPTTLRGRVIFPEGITQGPNIILLFEKADLSTFLHESGHFFFEIMTDMASKEGAPEQIIQDTQALLDWFGVKDIETWQGMDVDQRREFHEKFAEGFEVYLFEGKSPNMEIQGIFQRFRAWMVEAYRGVKAYLDPEKLTPEVRGVMDRMIATDAQIEAAEAARAYRPLFESAEDAGMNSAEWARYQANEKKSHAKATEELDKRSLRDMKWMTNAKGKELKRLQRDAAAKRKTARDEVSEEISNEPIYQTLTFLKKGEMTTPEGDAVKVEKGHKLDIDVLEEMFPKGELAPVDLAKLRGLKGKEGLHPDAAAEIFGFSSGDQLINAIFEAPPINDAIEAKTDQVMLERFGDITDPVAMERAAEEAIHNEARMRFVATELTALERLTGKKLLLARAAKEYAAQAISAKRVRDAGRTAPYAAAESRASREAEKALKKGDRDSAAQQKRTHLLNMYMFKEAGKANEEIEKKLRYLKKFDKKSVRKNLRGETVDQMDALLSRFDLRKAPPKEIPPLTEWVQDEAERLSAMVPELDPIIADERFKKHYKDMTLEEFRGLVDTVKQLEHMARRENKMYIEQRNMEFSAEKDAILDELKRTNPDAFDEEGLPKVYRKDTLPLHKELARKGISKFEAQLLSMENMLDTITYGEGHQLLDSLFGRISESADNETALMVELAEYLKPATKAYSKKEQAMFSLAPSRVLVPEVGEYFTRDKRISVAMFYGSEEGRQRLTGGNKYTEVQIKAILNKLDDRDLDFIEAYWKMNDELIWPKLEELDKRTKGKPAKKVKPVQFYVRGRLMRGGYVPLVYDGDLSIRAYDLNEDASIKDMRGGTVTYASTRQSASKERLEAVNRPLNLSLAGIAYKINETVHDVTHREAVTDTYRLLKSNRISNAIRKIAGPDVYNSMLIKVRETAVKPHVPHGFTERALWYARKNTLINMMGVSFNTFAINVLGVLPAMRRVGPGRFLKNLAKINTSEALAKYQWIMNKDPYMRQRHESFDRDMNTEINRFIGKGNLTPSMATYFAGLALMDRMITFPTWLSAYEESLAGMEFNEENDKIAVAYAGRVVRQTQGSGRVIDVAKVAGGVGVAGEWKKIFTMYYNFFGAQLGMMVRQGRISGKEWTAGKRAKAAMEFTLTTLAVVVIPSTLEAIVRGQCGDDPDAVDYMYCSARSSVFFVSSMFPLLRDVLPMAWKQFDPEVLAFGVRLTPIESSLEEVVRMPGSIRDVLVGEENPNDIRNILKGTGVLFGLPGYQASRTVEGYQAFMDGDTDNPLVTLTGPPRD